MFTQLFWHSAVFMASPPEQVAMQDRLCEPQSPSRRRMSDAQLMHSGALERIASDMPVEDGWGCGACCCLICGPAQAARKHSVRITRKRFIWNPSRGKRPGQEYARVGSAPTLPGCRECSSGRA